MWDHCTCVPCGPRNAGRLGSGEANHAKHCHSIPIFYQNTTESVPHVPNSAPILVVIGFGSDPAVIDDRDVGMDGSCEPNGSIAKVASRMMCLLR